MTTISTMGVLAYFRGSEVWTTPGDMQRHLDANQITAKVPDIVKVASARAQYASRNFRSKSRGPDIRIDSLGKRTADEAAYGILERTKISDSEVRWVQFDSVTWTRAYGWSTPRSPEGREFVDFARKCQTHLDYYWLRAMTFDQMRKIGALPMQGGGLQYIHGDNRMDRFQKLQAAVNSVPGAQLHSIKLDPEDGQTQSAVASAATEHLETQINEVVARLDEWKGKANGRTSTLENLLEEIEDARGHGLAIAIALKASTEAIERRMAEVEELINVRIAEAAQRAAAKAPQEQPALPGTEPTEQAAPVAQDDAGEADEATQALGQVADAVASLEGFPTPAELESGSRKQLLAWGRAFGIKGYAKLREDELQQALIDRREQLAAG